MTETQTPHLTVDERITAYGRLVDAQRRLHRMFGRSLRDRVGISIVWYEALLRLGRSPERQMPINGLGEALELTSGGATRLVDRLEESGFVERVGCPTDRRVSWVRLTEDGMTVLTDATRVHLDDLDEHFVTKLSSDELTTLTELLGRFRSNA